VGKSYRENISDFSPLSQVPRSLEHMNIPGFSLSYAHKLLYQPHRTQAAPEAEKMDQKDNLKQKPGRG